MQKTITNEGKKELLKKGFGIDSEAFTYLALGVGTGDDFEEVNGNGYQRAVLEYDATNDTESDSKITLSATFGDDNCTGGSNTEICQIGIAQKSTKTTGEKFFAFAPVPTIKKDNNITLKYTIIVQIE